MVSECQGKSMDCRKYGIECEEFAFLYSIAERKELIMTQTQREQGGAGAMGRAMVGTETPVDIPRKNMYNLFIIC